MSQVRLAADSGISRRTILNLEAGDANVSLSSLDRLAAALGVTFVDLVAPPASSSARIGAVAWRGTSPASKAVLLGTAPAREEAQMWSWDIGPGDRYDAEPDPADWHEMIYVVEGRLRIEFSDSHLMVEPGDFAIYSSAQAYAYVCASDVPTRFIRNVVS